MPSAEVGADPILAILHNYASHIEHLTIRLQWHIADSSDSGPEEDEMQQIITESTTMHGISGLFTVIHSLPEVLQSCSIEIDLGANANCIIGVLGEGPAMQFLGEKLRSFLENGWPRFARNINFIWRHSEKHHAYLDPKQILITLLSALYTFQRDNVKLSDPEFVEMKEWIGGLLQSGVVTSCWKSY